MKSTWKGDPEWDAIHRELSAWQEQDAAEEAAMITEAKLDRHEGNNILAESSADDGGAR